MTARLGKYLLLERINQGGMADVYLAKAFGYGGADQVLAVKCIRPEVGADPNFVSMFIDEAKLAVQLSHANVAPTFELGRIGMTYFIAMELVLGRDLRALVDRAGARGVKLAPGLMLHIIAQVLDGLDYAHRKTDLKGTPLQIVHRDISPQNVLVSYTGEVKLIDFGIAKASSHATQTQAGIVRGKYGYMSPEQVQGQPVDARSDLFAAGALLYELLTGERLFPGASDVSILEKVRYVEIYPPSLVVPDLPEDVERLLLKALERDPRDRFHSASDMRDATVEVMLRHYGHPSARELGALMQELFAEERKRDLAIIDEADQIVAMPANVPELDELRAASAEQQPAPDPGQRTDPAGVAGLQQAPESREEAASAASPGEERTDRIRLSQPSTDEPDDVADAPREDTVIDRPSFAAVEERRRVTVERGAPTEIYSVRRRRHLWRDALIVMAALTLGLGIIGATWMATRPQQEARYGGLVVTSRPVGADVIIDGAQVGTTPFSSPQVLAGRRELLLRKPGFADASEKVKVVADEVVTIELTLEAQR